MALKWLQDGPKLASVWPRPEAPLIKLGHPLGVGLWAQFVSKEQLEHMDIHIIPSANLKSVWVKFVIELDVSWGFAESSSAASSRNDVPLFIRHLGK